MATKKITQLPAATAVIGTDLVPIVDDPSGTAVTQKSTWTLVRDFILGVSGGIVNIPEETVFEDDVTVEDNLFVEGPAVAENDGIGVAAAATSWRRSSKVVPNVVGAVATSVLTVTIPNAGHAASIRAFAVASMESNQLRFTSSEAIATFARTSGNNTLAVVTEVGEASVNPAQVTFAWSLAAVSGASSATQTRDIQVTVSDSGGSDEWTVTVAYEILNEVATGMTIA